MHSILGLPPRQNGSAPFPLLTLPSPLHHQCHLRSCRADLDLCLSLLGLVFHVRRTRTTSISVLAHSQDLQPHYATESGWARSLQCRVSALLTTPEITTAWLLTLHAGPGRSGHERRCQEAEGHYGTSEGSDTGRSFSTIGSTRRTPRACAIRCRALSPSAARGRASRSRPSRSAAKGLRWNLDERPWKTLRGAGSLASEPPPAPLRVTLACAGVSLKR